MAVVVYSNGIVEEFRPVDFTFTEDELIRAFENYPTLRSSRLPDIPNTWLLWGEMPNPPDEEYNKLGDEILDIEVYSHIILIHDSEINPSWNATDDILYKSYNDFTHQVKEFLESISDDIVKRNQEEMTEEEANSMIFLITMGHTKDKRVLFAFNPHEQNDMFFVDGSFDKFAFKLYDYINENFDPDPAKPFIVFADSKTVVIVEDRYVYDLIDRMIATFKLKEKYEMCSRLAEIKTIWKKSHTPENPAIAEDDVSIGEIVNRVKKAARKRKPKSTKDDGTTE